MYDLYGYDWSNFVPFEEASYELSIRKNDPITQVWIWELICAAGSTTNCRVKYSRNMTPRLYYLSPNVVYKDQEISIYVNPMQAQDWGKAANGLPFLDAKFDGTLMQFEEYHDEQIDYTLSAWNTNQVVGKVGDQQPNQKSDFKIKFVAGYAMEMYSLQVCPAKYSNVDECYSAKTVPVINSISPNPREGYINGGQELTIRGHGLGVSGINSASVQIDGQTCAIHSQQNIENTDKSIISEIKCVTSATSSPTVDSGDIIIAGQPGLRRVVTFSGNGTTLNEGLTSFEIRQNRIPESYSQVISGLFKAPLDATYTFYISGDDGAELYFNPTGTDRTRDDTKTRKIANNGGWNYWRNYGRTSQKSSAFTLTKDQLYYIEAVHSQGSGDDHLTVAVQIQVNAGDRTDNHMHSTKEIQTLKISPTINVNYEDTSKIVVIANQQNNYPFSDSDVQKFKIKLRFPKKVGNDDNNFEASFNAGASASSVQSAINRYYKNISGIKSTITVTRRLYNSNDQQIGDDDLANAKKIEYQIKVDKLLNALSIDSTVESLSPELNGNPSGIISYQFVPPVAQSSTPLEGKFIIKGKYTEYSPDPSNPSNLIGTVRECQTDELSYNSNANKIKNNLAKYCPMYRDGSLWDDYSTFPYYQNGREIKIRFNGFNEDIPNFELVNSAISPLLIGQAQVAFTIGVPQTYSNEFLWYDPIPFEWLYMDNTLPKIQVVVDGQEAVCPDGQCDYTYVANEAKITAWTKAGDTQGSEITITGENLPTAIADILELTYSKVKCTPTTLAADGTEVKCTLDAAVVTGQAWRPELRVAKGLVVHDGSTTEDKAITVSGITFGGVALSGTANPLNPEGKQILQIAGSDFPTDLISGHSISVTFQDTTVCTVKSTTSALITCETQKFVSAAGQDNQQITITINSLSDTSYQAQIGTSPATITSISPNSASPVLRTTLTLQISDTSTALVQANLRVDLHKYISATETQYIRELRIKEVRDLRPAQTYQEIDIIFGGAPSAEYIFIITDSTYGVFSPGTVRLTAEGKVQTISISSGSAFGGDTITITGINFSNDPLDNNVKIGKTDCIVSSSSATQIVCTTEATPNGYVTTTKSEKLLVFLKASEEAVCDSGFSNNNCMFEWVATNKPVIASYTYALDNVQNGFVVTFNGANFVPNQANLLIDGLSQSIITADSTTNKIVAKITGMKGTNSRDIILSFTNLGRAQSLVEIVQKDGIQLTPVLQQVSPNTGSSGGQLLTAIVRGLGTETTDVHLLDNSDEELCSSLTITAFETIECITKSKEYTSAFTVKLKIGDAAASSCSEPPSGSSSDCQYQTQDTGLATIASTTPYSGSDAENLVITGTDFTGTVEVSFGGVVADSSTVDSATQITAAFIKGVPLVDDTPMVKITDSGNTYYAVGASVYDQTLASFTITAGVQASFAGGYELEITQTGMTSTLSGASTTYIDVCGERCELINDAAKSDKDKATCRLPALGTTYSSSTFSIVNEGTLHGEIRSISGQTAAETAAFTQQAQKLFDGDPKEGWTQQGQSYCDFGVRFKPGHVAHLTNLKYFMNYFADSTKYVDQLKFQGNLNENPTNTDAGWVDIFTVDDSINEGWNYHDFSADNLKYHYYRFIGTDAGACVIGEVVLYGVELIDDNNNYRDCTPTLMQGETVVASATANIRYSGTNTPALADTNPISQKSGNVKGGDSITFTGTGFDGTTMANNVVTIDTKECTVTAATATSITCTTQLYDSTYKGLPMLTIHVQGKGYVATKGNVFRYVFLWSDIDSWNGDLLPADGDSIHIPTGITIKFDLTKEQSMDLVYNLVLIEGALIFEPDEADPTTEAYFNARYIFVNEGTLQVGTEDSPYSSKITITMFGTKASPEIPIYGNKVIGVRKGTLDLHGIKRDKTWTDLDATADIGATSITLIEAVDWQAGEKIVIAPTSYSSYEVEERVITGVSTAGSKTTIDFAEPLVYKHFSGTDSKTRTNQDGTSEVLTIEMRAEVGLLTRNVKFRGDPSDSNRLQFGGHIMLHSDGSDSLTGRISYIELEDVGQAFQLGRYPIHFHMIGDVHNSYVKGNAIHHTYNRACTIHGVHYLRVIENVAYNTMGHTFFIEDAVETNNILEKNLALLTRRSMSLLNTDQTPGSFWITHPNNIFRGNRAAGSDRYGFWFDLMNRPIGLAAATYKGIVPINERLGEFTNNVAHSCRNYGLRIFHGHIPRKISKSAISDTNPSIPAIYDNFTGYKCGRNGAIMEDSGDVRFNNFKVADNKLAGIEFSRILTNAGTARIENALVIGHSVNADAETLASSPHGIITPRTENFQVDKVTFHNFDQNNMAALGSCSHCFHAAATDSGARQVLFSNIHFDATVTKRIRYQLPWRAIFYAADGSLTDGDSTVTGITPGDKSYVWATGDWKHNYQAECLFTEEILAKYNGPICSNAIQVRRLAWHSYKPNNLFDGMELKVLQYDDSQIVPNKADYEADHSKYSSIPFKKSLDPSNGWAVPFVTNHRYLVMWRNGLDFEQMQMDQSSKWLSTDHPVIIRHNYTDIRAKIDFTVGGVEVANHTNPEDNPPAMTIAQARTFTLGNHVHNIQQEYMEYSVNGLGTETSMTIKGHRCINSCNAAAPIVEVELTARRWSDPNAWIDATDGTGRRLQAGTVPVSGSVEIKAGWNMIYDLPADAASPNFFDQITVNGRLKFDPDMDLHLKVKQLFVHRGELIIDGTPVDLSAEEDDGSIRRYSKNCVIELMGDQQSAHMAFTNEIEAGNKIIANTGSITMYGQSRPRIKRLLQPAQANTNVIYVKDANNWQPGEQLGLAPTGSYFEEVDFVTIDRIESEIQGAGENQIEVWQKIILKEQLTYYHYGAADSTVNADSVGGIDMRGEVYLLSSNIKIMGEGGNGWGGQIVTSDYQNVTNTWWYYGGIIMDNVELYNCSQRDTTKAAIRFEKAQIDPDTEPYRTKKITNCAIHNGLGRGIHVYNSMHVELSNNIIFNFRVIGVNLQTVTDVKFSGNHVIGVKEREITALDMFVDPNGAIVVCGYVYSSDTCSRLTITNNYAIGANYCGIGTYAPKCDGTDGNVMFGNVAHSNNGMGGIFYPAPGNGGCYKASGFIAYNNIEVGALQFFGGNEAIMENMIIVGNDMGIASMIGTGAEPAKMKLNNIKIFGEGPEGSDCRVRNACLGSKADKVSAWCHSKTGFIFSYNAVSGKDPYPRSKSSLPLYKIKGNGAWGGITEFTNVEFHNFQEQTWCGTKPVAMEMNPTGADYHPIQNFKGVTFNNVHKSSLAFFMDPPLGWANSDDCGDFPCTGPQQFSAQFESATFTGVTPGFDMANFALLPNNEKAAEGFNICDPAQNQAECCERVDEWNGYLCKTNNAATLLFESLDADKSDRMVSPIIITSYTQPYDYSNVLNTFMDHVWDGFYTGQIRLSRFPALVRVNKRYNITYTGTPPEKQRFTLRYYGEGDQAVNGVIVSIDYPKAGAYQVKQGSLTGTQIEYNEWNEEAMQPIAVVGFDRGRSNVVQGARAGQCGENRFIGVENILEFFLTPGCELYILTRDAIMTRLRLEWTLNEFFASGGTTKFIDRLSASLGIHASTVRTVSLYEGSVIVEFQITDANDDATVLAGIETNLKSKIADQTLDVGAPILDASISDIAVNFGDATIIDSGSGSTTTGGTTTDPTTGTDTTGTDTTNPTIIEVNNTLTEEQNETIPEENNVNKIVILLASIVGALILFTITVIILYKRFRPTQSQVIKTKPDGEAKATDEEYEAQYHPKAELGNMFGKQSADKVNEADNLDQLNDTNGHHSNENKPSSEDSMLSGRNDENADQSNLDKSSAPFRSEDALQDDRKEVKRAL